jgi:alanine dehydrogenase
MNLASTLLLDRSDVASLLTLPECIAAVEAAFLAHATGRSFTPGLLHVDAIGGEFHVKAGGVTINDRSYFALKANGGFFGNAAANGLPNILGVIYLADASNGYPLAVMDSLYITALRTGAATAIAARYLARDDATTATICGAGRQGRIQLRALCETVSLESAFIWSRDENHAAAAASELSEELGIPVKPAASLPRALESSDIVVTCTPSREPIIKRSWIAPGTFVAAVGADSPDKQELDPELMVCATIVTDITDQCAHVGELHHALNRGVVRLADVKAELGELIAGRSMGRSGRDEITIFDSTGTALQDAAAAALTYDKAIAAGRGTTMEFFR